MKLTFDVWRNARGELHITCDDPALEKPVNVRLRPGLESTRVLGDALAVLTVIDAFPGAEVVVGNGGDT